MTFANQYSWEVTHITVIGVVITTLTLVTYLFGSPRTEVPPVAGVPLFLRKDMSPSSGGTAQSVPRALAVQVPTQHGTSASQQSDPREIIVGPSGISNRYRLLSLERKTVSPQSDELTVRLHVESLAMENLVSPFESDMLEITSPGLQPIKPKTPFRLPIPSGDTRNQDVVFNIPSGLSLNRTTLRIRYYNYQNDLPLSLPRP